MWKSAPTIKRHIPEHNIVESDAASLRQALNVSTEDRRFGRRFYQITGRQISMDTNFHFHRCEKQHKLHVSTETRAFVSGISLQLPSVCPRMLSV
jgi:hypothetical protein